MLDTLALIAQTTEPGGQATPPGSLLSNPLMLLVAMGFIFYFVMIRPQGKEKKRRKSMLDLLKKNDRVVTIGGIVGTVTTVRDDEVTLKVDESSNTKITFSRSAIQRVMGATAEPAADDKTKS
jgi:preprotein translocase subunit YajC